ncbi:hypothetical protein MNBD_GAMMA21-2122 [hydrothermal vent metagenome]|uniref:Uncharacterized protein n=1 Tax=hydrothermal vent metagenome TaxID=652676 RepID=A0A3B1A3X7_9ZZZZ
MGGDYLVTHLNSARALYRQRMGLLQSSRVDMQSMLDLEFRMRVHIHVLANQIDEDQAEPEQAADAFIYLAARFSSKDEVHQASAAQQACEWLLEDSPVAHGARDALMLFPLPDAYSVMQKTYRDVESLRPVLIYILTQQGAHLPKSLTHQAELQNQDPFLQAQTLYYAANDHKSDAGMFRDYYDSLLDDNKIEELDHSALVAAIWGGLVRGEDDAWVALQRAIANEGDDIQRLDFLRFAALSGKEQYFPMLANVAEHAPEVGYHFLALHGQTQSVQAILDGLIHPRTANYAEQAWWWVSGQILPKMPRLAVVGEENDTDNIELEDEVGYVPDAKPAQHWWAKQQQDASARWLQGQSFSISTVHKLMTQYSGVISNDLFDLYAITTHTPLRLGNYIWHDTRLIKINSLSQNESLPVNPEVRSA